MAFTRLPVEVISHVLGYCDAASTVRCAMTCKRLQAVVQSTEIQLNIMLDVCGMLDTGHGNLTMSERLDGLRSYEGAWRTLANSGLLEFRQEATRLARIDVRDGIVAMICDKVGANAVVVHRLPSMLRGISHRTWQWPCTTSVQRLLIYPMLDLALLASYNEQKTKMHFMPRKLSTGEPHPSAKANMVDVEIQFPYLLTTRYSLCGINIAFYSDALRMLQVVNWTTGAVVARLHETNECMLIGPHHILSCKLPDAHQPASIVIYRMDPDSPGSPVQHMSTLLLPDFAEEVLVLRPPGNFDTEARQQSWRNMRHDCTFFPAPRPEGRAVFLLAIGSWLENYELEVPALALLEYSVRARARPEGPLIVPWEDLSALGAAIRPAVSISTTSCTPSARRFMFRPPTWQAQRGPRFQCMSYGSLCVARARQDGVPEVTTAEDAARLVRIDDGNVFLQGNVEGQVSTFIDARRAPASLFVSKRGGIAGLPVPRLVAVRVPPSGPTDAASQITMDSFTEDGFVYILGDEDTRTGCGYLMHRRTICCTILHEVTVYDKTHVDMHSNTASGSSRDCEEGSLTRSREFMSSLRADPSTC
ncbi:hypothetical protein K488DRAFT_70019 [Vararia minispora EC-137]|uniref:Uncharacterized protein n=1 Tax=Vararia minispora EC-137 TaxID=1314806 RepID=A0ACB8QN06_9AGAM|nr:hypothetical protein K488DRAFT_70019 [Vararia minispora EC-137]